MAMEVSSIAAELDDEGQRYLDIQRHAAAVQLYSRSLAIAHLRAQLAMPRGATVRTKRDPKARMKQEDGSYQAVPQLRQQCPAHERVQPAIVVPLAAPAADFQQEAVQQQLAPQQGMHCAFKPRRLVHRIPDPAAVQRFRADEMVDDTADADLAAQQAAARAPAPRIVADPSQSSHQLAGWVKVAGEGAEVEGLGEGEQGMEDEGLTGLDVAEPEDDLMDEEEWV